MWIIRLFVNPQPVSLHNSRHTKIKKTYNHENVKIHNSFHPTLLQIMHVFMHEQNMFHIDTSSVN
jgi:hypothetical protein